MNLITEKKGKQAAPMGHGNFLFFFDDIPSFIISGQAISCESSAIK